MKEGANVVISFPIEKIYRVPTPDSIQESMERAQKNYITSLVDENASLLVSRLAMSGIDVSGEEFQKYYALTIECLRSTIYKSMNLHHPLQTPMNDIIEAIEQMANKKV